MACTKSVIMLAFLALVSGRNVLLVQNENSFHEEYPSRCSFKHYTALGDSFSAGINVFNGELPICNGTNGNNSGPLYCTSGECSQNYASYAWKIHETYAKGKKCDYLACNGANTNDVIQNQLPHLSSESDMVTLTVGGNNNELFSTAVLNCVYKLPSNKDLCTKSINSANVTINNIKPDIASVITEIRKKAPDARIALLGYVQFWANRITRCENAFLEWTLPTTKSAFNELTLNLNTKLREVAEEHRVDYIDVDPYFQNHRFCDSSHEPWLQHEIKALQGPQSVFHPNKAGQMLYFAAFKARYGC